MKNKKGKKLVVLGAMAALLTLIGVSGSQTYAKYVESAQVPAQQATVAKWSYVLSADAYDLFGKTHDTKTPDLVTTIKSGGVGVKSTNNVVAPGTKGQMTFAVSGKSEVFAKLSIDFTNEVDIVLNYDGAPVYSPVVWKLTDNTTTVAGVDTLKEVADHFNADVELSPSDESYTHSYVLSYEWAFEKPGYSGVLKDDKDNSDPTDDVYYTFDELDTILGEISNSGSTTHPTLTKFTAVTTVSFDFAMELVQIQHA